MEKKLRIIAVAAIIGLIMAGCNESAMAMEMVRVEGGTFELGRELGTAGSGDTTPVSTVTLTGFYMGKFSVTQGEWYDVMGSWPSSFTGDNAWSGGNSIPATPPFNRRELPVEQVSWYDMIVFANRLSALRGLTPAYELPNVMPNPTSWTTDPATWGAVPRTWDDPERARWDAVRIRVGSTGYRLPTEAQWEFAAKGGNRGETYTFSGSNDVDEVAWHWGNSGGRTREVGRLAPNGLGIYDMSGNVWEWVWDWWGSYTSEEKVDPTGASSRSECVFRGGSWGSLAVSARSVSRGGHWPCIRWFNAGVRLVRP
ncbi:MAG: formylglycine-generating enzyme family protein [Treponema sp.]|nr:formylglycine-generating enzyme family protein [Treponema sp.]